MEDSILKKDPVKPHRTLPGLYFTIKIKGKCKNRPEKFLCFFGFFFFGSRCSLFFSCRHVCFNGRSCFFRNVFNCGNCLFHSSFSRFSHCLCYFFCHFFTGHILCYYLFFYWRRRRRGFDFYFGRAIHSGNKIAFCFFCRFAAGSDSRLFLLNPLHEFRVGLFLSEYAFFNAKLEVFFQKNTLETKNSAHSVSGLCAHREPMVGSVTVDFNRGRNGEGVVSAEFFDKTAVAGRASVSDDDVVKRCAFATFALQAKFDCNVLKFENFSEKKTRPGPCLRQRRAFRGRKCTNDFPEKPNMICFCAFKTWPRS